MKHRLLALSLVLTPCFASAPVEAAPPPTASADVGVVQGVVKDSTTTLAIEGALVILQCTCLDGEREVLTNSRGIYTFAALPPGNYTIQVFTGVANVSKITELPRGAKFRANFSIDPGVAQTVEIIVESTIARRSATTMTMSMEEAKMLPVGRSPRIGTLTAGTLDDNLDLSSLSHFTQQSFAANSTERELGLGLRTEVIVVDTKGRPINDAELEVSSADGQRRRSVTLRTGTDGRAIINGGWDLGIPSSLARLPSLRIVARKAGVQTVKQVTLGAGPVRIQLAHKRSKAEAQVAALDLVLVVDTTGSMSDELDWLTTELRSVVAQSLADHPGIDARVGVVAYRDIGDSYVTRRFELSSHQQDFQGFLDQQAADGGGDYPEAVDAALAQAATFDWRHDKQAAKVVLLVADAPPHDARLRQTFEATSQLRAAGVSIYPISSSGVQDQAELVFRVIAADTGAQYLFLTDDSGVGNPHADPHADNYEVELLRDALLRLLAAELSGERASLPVRPKWAAFTLQKSLFDDGGQHEITGGPTISFDLN